MPVPPEATFTVVRAVPNTGAAAAVIKGNGASDYIEELTASKLILKMIGGVLHEGEVQRTGGSRVPFHFQLRGVAAGGVNDVDVSQTGDHETRSPGWWPPRSA